MCYTDQTWGQRTRSVSNSDPRTWDKVLVKYQNLNLGRLLDQDKLGPREEKKTI